MTLVGIDDFQWEIAVNLLREASHWLEARVLVQFLLLLRRQKCQENRGAHVLGPGGIKEGRTQL